MQKNDLMTANKNTNAWANTKHCPAKHAQTARSKTLLISLQNMLDRSTLIYGILTLFYYLRLNAITLMYVHPIKYISKNDESPKNPRRMKTKKKISLY